ncbi:MAG: hypothetical protein P8N42_06900, partial [Hyphomicrobiales bacterium]|nr:hypothetical protein [Hyphomicrobiales bacterium]
MLKNINNNSRIGWSDLSLEARFRIVESLTNIYISYQSIALGSADPIEVSEKNKTGAPTKKHDSVSTMIKVKILSSYETNCKWTNMNSIIHYIRSKGGKYSNISR